MTIQVYKTCIISTVLSVWQPVPSELIKSVLIPKKLGWHTTAHRCKAHFLLNLSECNSYMRNSSPICPCAVLPVLSSQYQKLWSRPYPKKCMRHQRHRQTQTCLHVRFTHTTGFSWCGKGRPTCTIGGIWVQCYYLFLISYLHNSSIS